MTSDEIAGRLADLYDENQIKTQITARIEVGKMSDPEKIAKAVGMMEVSKAVCINSTFQNDAQRVATILQITTDAVLSVLKDDE